MSEIVAIAVPKWGIEMVEGTINGWNKSEGDAVSKGDEILEIESDKIVNAWEAPAGGILRRILVSEGEVRDVGQLLGIIAAADVDDEAIDAFIADYAEGEADKPAPAAVSAPVAPSAAKPARTAETAPEKAASAGGGRRANPVVKRLAAELGVELDSLTGTGRNGRITQDDVRAAADGSAGSTGDSAASADYQVIPFSSTRKTIARRLTEAKQQIPHYYLSVDWEVDALLEHHARLNESGGQKVSLNDLLVYCCARALMKVPEININVVDEEVHQFHQANIAVAIATDQGLYPAVIHGAESLSAEEIASATAALAEKAKGGNLAHGDIHGGSFTISNLGMLGIDTFTAIINPPMGAILALGRAGEKAVVRDGNIVAATLISATLSCDHRAIDGAMGARFLGAVKEEMANLA